MRKILLLLLFSNALMAQPFVSQQQPQQIPLSILYKNSLPQEGITTPRQPEENSKFAFVNLRQVMALAPQILGIQNSLLREFASAKKSLEEQQESLQQLEALLKNEHDAQALAELQRQIAIKRRDAERAEIIFRDDFSIRRNEELFKVEQIVGNEITKLAKTLGYSAVLNENGVLYAAQSIDLTALVIERLQILKQTSGIETAPNLP